MPYPMLPADAADGVFQMLWCGVTLMFAMISWIACLR